MPPKPQKRSTKPKPNTTTTKTSAPMPLTIERPVRAPDPYRRLADELLTVRVGRHAIETTIAYGGDYWRRRQSDAVASWLADIARPLRCTKGPLVVGACLFRGVNFHDFGRGDNDGSLDGGLALALCFGGDQVLVFQGQPRCYVSPGDRAAAEPDLRSFLGNSRLNFVGVMACKDAQWIEKHWAMKVARPVDLHKLAVMAVGEEKAWDVQIKRGVPVMRALTIEELAKLPEFGGMVVEKKNAKEILHGNYGQHHDKEINDAKVMQATLYAFLCYEIGVKAIKKIGRLVVEDDGAAVIRLIFRVLFC